MKKYAIIFIFVLGMMIPLNLFALSISTGANVWYSWFEPGFKDKFMGKDYSTSSSNTFEMTEPASFVYGGMLATQITDRISLGGVFSYGTGWKAKSEYIFFPNDPTATMFMHFYGNINKMERFEGDLTLNYALNNMFKVFFGWKYFGERGKGDYYLVPAGYEAYANSPLILSRNLKGDFKFSFDSNGPGAGVTSKFNLTDNLFLITTLSGIYQMSESEENVTGVGAKVVSTSEKYYGGNGLLNFAYVIPETSVTLSLGGRYQYLKNIDRDAPIKFYGVMFSTIYTFEI